LLALVRALETITRLASAAALDVVAEVDRRGVAGDHGCTSTAVLLRHLLRLSPADAAERMRLARAVADTVEPSGTHRPAALPATAEGLRAAEIHIGHARVISRMLA